MNPTPVETGNPRGNRQLLSFFECSLSTDIPKSKKFRSFVKRVEKANDEKFTGLIFNANYFDLLNDKSRLRFELINNRLQCTRASMVHPIK